MIKMQIVMDDAKIIRERRYNAEKIHGALDTLLVRKLGMVKDENGFYLGTGSSQDFSRFGLAYSALADKDWFLENVDKWLYYNSDASHSPDDFVVEDFKGHCLQKMAKVS